MTGRAAAVRRRDSVGTKFVWIVPRFSAAAGVGVDDHDIGRCSA